MTTAPSPTGPRTVIVVAKEPVPGEVKTRLCPPCTPAQAAVLAGAALADTLEAVAEADVDRRVLVLDGEPGPWLPDGVEVIEQRPGPFATRLDGAWADAVGDRPGPTVQIGMDTPQVTPQLLEASLDALDDADAALGPALDGGWWALALRRYRPGLFDGVPMSADDTHDHQHHRLREQLGTEPARLSLLRDVDRMEDAREVAQAIPGSAFARALALLPTA